MRKLVLVSKCIIYGLNIMHDKTISMAYIRSDTRQKEGRNQKFMTVKPDPYSNKTHVVNCRHRVFFRLQLITS